MSCSWSESSVDCRLRLFHRGRDEQDGSPGNSGHCPLVQLISWLHCQGRTDMFDAGGESGGINTLRVRLVALRCLI